jgi:hypothetical protein
MPARTKPSKPLTKGKEEAPLTRGFFCIGETGFEPATARPPAQKCTFCRSEMPANTLV